MPIMRKSEIEQLLPEERVEKLSELRTELLHLRTMVSSGGTMENPTRIRDLRKTIARIMTLKNSEKKAKKGAK